MLNKKNLSLIGYASGLGGPDPKGGEGPLTLRHSPFLRVLEEKGIQLHWKRMITSDEFSSLAPNMTKLEQVSLQCQALANEVNSIALQKEFFVALGGDHSCAIGTWSGAKAALGTHSLGLIWIDAHMDSHTPATSLTGNCHGMPVASLLGYGHVTLTNLSGPAPKFNPAQICLIGVRSYEAEEKALLESLNVRIFYMDDIRDKSFHDVLKEAIKYVKNSSTSYGITIDIDSMDPLDAPGTDVAEPDGIRAEDLCEGLKQVASDEQLIGIEIAEFDPYRDQEQKTEKIIGRLLSSIVLGK